MSDKPNVLYASLARNERSQASPMLTAWEGEDERGVIVCMSPDVAAAVAADLARAAEEARSNPWLGPRSFVIFTDQAMVRRNAEAGMDVAGERFLAGTEADQ